MIKDQKPYLIYACLNCKQFSYVKTTQKTAKCLRCGRFHKVSKILHKGEIVKGITAAMNHVKEKQNQLSINESKFQLNLRTEGDFSPVKHSKKKSKKFIVGYHGVLGNKKGADIFIDAIKIVNKYNLPIEFNVTGEGDLKKELKKLKNVKYHGYVSIKDKIKYMAQNNITIAPYNRMIYGNYPVSKDTTEVYLPTKVAESLCLGIPVVAPDVMPFKNYPNILFKIADLEKLPIKSETYDLCYLACVLEHHQALDDLCGFVVAGEVLAYVCIVE